MLGGLDCHASLAMTGGGVAGLPRFARNDGGRGTGLPRFARNDGGRGTGLLHFVRNDGEKGTGESKTLKKFEKNCFISLLEYT